MFEEFTERARRVMIFTRYEASQLGGNYVEPEHLLLGLLREDKAISAKFIGSFGKIEAIRKQVVERTHQGERISISVDIPLSKAPKSVLVRAEKERAYMSAANVGTEHLLLGLLQEGSLAAQVLRERGVEVQLVRINLNTPFRRDKPRRE